MATVSAVQWGVAEGGADTTIQTGTGTYLMRDHVLSQYSSIVALTFRFNGTSAIAQGSSLASVKLTVRQNNAVLANSTHSELLYVAVENNLQGGPSNPAALTVDIPTGTNGSGRRIQKRLSADSGAQAIWGNRTGLTHNGNLSSDTPASPVDSRAYVVHATAGRGASTAGTDLTTDNFASALQPLVNDAGWNSTDQYVTVFLFWSGGDSSAWSWQRYPMNAALTWASGQSGSNNAHSNTGGQLNYSVTPTLSVTLAYTNWAPTMDNSGSNVVAEVADSAYFVISDITYYGVSAMSTSLGGSQRVLDLYTPLGSRPASGWPTIVYVHGGRWTVGGKTTSTTDENYIAPSFITRMAKAGYAVISVQYRLMQENINPNAIFFSFPQNLHDVFAVFKWTEVNASTYNLDNNKVIAAGHSAGGYLAAFATIAAKSGDSTTYTGRQNSNGTRPAAYGYTSTANPWYFDLDESAQLSVTKPPVGIMLWDSPIDIYQATTIGGLAGTANSNARTALYGEATGQTVYASQDEADLNRYIAGNGNTYTTPVNKAKIPPMFFMYSTTQDLVLNSSSVTAMYNALNAITYDVSTAVGTLNTNGGLTRHGVARNHAQVLLGQGPNFTEEIAWLNQVAPSSTPKVYVGTNSASSMKVGTNDVTAAYIGTTQVWP